MHNFRKEYQKEWEQMPVFRPDAELLKQRAAAQQKCTVVRYRKTAWAACAACLVLLCTMGTGLAMDYYSSEIRIGNGGFAFLGKKSADAADAAAVPEECALEEAIEEAVEEECADIEAAEADAEIVEKTYDSIQQFYEMEDIDIAIPSLELLCGGEEPLQQMVSVIDELSWVRVMVSFPDKFFSMTQEDNRMYPEYASSTVFMGETVNERVLKNDQGLEWQLFDSSEDGKTTSTHAALSVNGRDLILSFSGYENQEIDAVLKQLDVSIYFTE